MATMTQAAVPRYTQKSFPRYRYIPAHHPHPEIDPKGHSYAHKAPPLRFTPPNQWMQNETYLYGIDLFNHGYWWEAHEAWERVWLTTPKLDLHGQFLQALIQYSAAFLKLYSGNKKGYDKLLGEAQQRMETCLKKISQEHRHYFMGLNIPEWRKKLAIFCQSLHDPAGEILDPLGFASFPYLLLENRHP